jgi:hypothetical protein
VGVEICVSSRGPRDLDDSYNMVRWSKSELIVFMVSQEIPAVRRRMRRMRVVEQTRMMIAWKTRRYRRMPALW